MRVRLELAAISSEEQRELEGHLETNIKATLAMDFKEMSAFSLI